MDEKQLWQRFNLSPVEPAALHAAQGGLCPICKRPLELGSPATCTEHNHKTGLVRGLCCFLCNRALGLFGDDVEKLKAAIAYLEKPPAITAIGKRFGHIGRATKKHGKKRKFDFYRRGEQSSGGVAYLCGCRDCGLRPQKVCPVHGQPKI